MGRYSVSTRGMASVDVDGANWLFALGTALERWGGVDRVERLVVEVQRNGTVIAMDVTSGRRWIVAPQTEVQGLAVDVSEIAEAPTWELACERALAHAASIAAAGAGSIMWLEGEYLRFGAVLGAPELLGVLIPRETGIAGHCLRTGRALSLADVKDEPRHFARVADLTGIETRDLACLPLGEVGEAWGVLEVLNAERPLDRTQLDALREIAEALHRRRQAGG